MFKVFNPARPYPARGYSHAVQMGNLLFVSGQAAIDETGKLVGEENTLIQTERTFSNLRTVLEEAGTSMEQVGKLTIYLTPEANIQQMASVYLEVFKPYNFLPAMTGVIVTALFMPGLLVEIEAVALLKD